MGGWQVDQAAMSPDRTDASRGRGRRIARFGALAAIGLLAVLRARADEPPAPEIEQVTVTARRLAENLETVPIAITSLGRESLEQDTIQTVYDLQSHVPSLQIDADALNGSAVPNFTIRGLSRVLGTDPSTVTYFDEVPQSGRGIAESIYDVADIQVLRGPQGVAFGKNSTGGDVLFTPERPTDQYQGLIQGQWGNYGDEDYTGMLNIPIDDRLAVRFAGDVERRDGTTRNIAGPALDDRDHGSARLSLDWKPLPNVENYTVADGFTAHEHNVALKLVGVGTCESNIIACFFTPGSGTIPIPPFLPFFAPGAANLPAVLAEAQALGPRAADIPFPQLSESNIYGVADTTTVKLFDTGLGDITFKNIAGYRHESDSTAIDLSGSPVALLDIQNSDSISQLSEELQAVGVSPRGDYDWLFGVFFAGITDAQPSQNAQNFALGAFPNPQATLLFTLSGDAGDPIGPQATSGPNVLDSQSTALYGRVSYHLSGAFPDLPRWASQASLDLGYRMTWDDYQVKSQLITDVATAPPIHQCVFLDPATGLPLPGSPPGSVDAATCTRTGTASFAAPNWSIGAHDQITDLLLAYVVASHGYKAGGLNFYAVSPADDSFQPERATNFEIGTKADFHLGALPVRTNLALYHEDYTNIQTQVVVVEGGTPQSLITNANHATIDGGELEVFTKPLPDLELNGSYSLTQAVYTDFATEVNGVPAELGGVDLPDVSRSTYVAAMTWHLPVAEAWGDPALTADYYYRTKQIGNAQEPLGPFNTVPGYGITNLRLEWRGIAGSSIDAGLFVNNLADRLYPIAVSDERGSLLYATVQYGEPRLFGGMLRYRF
jgi:iron complex outermembrane recepter protein